MDNFLHPPDRGDDRSENGARGNPSEGQHEWSPDWEPHVPEEPSLFSVLYLPVILFIVTAFTTLWAGAFRYTNLPSTGAWDFLVRYPENLLNGWPFAFTLLGILVTHEFGHYYFSRIHRVPASLPLFIPGPPQFIGTFGAIIRMRSPIRNRRALFDIGVAGPIAGFVVAVVALFIGLTYSTVAPNLGFYGIHLGEPLLLQFFAWLIFGPIPDTYEIALHPVAAAAWFGLFVTAINLIPIGQLDGGHVAYALFGQNQRTIALAIIPILLFFGVFGWVGWFIWVGLASLIGVAHPPVIDPTTELGRGRVCIGWLAIAIFILSFSPVPFYVG